MTLREAFKALVDNKIIEFTYSGRQFNKSDLNNVVSNPVIPTEKVEITVYYCLICGHSTQIEGECCSNSMIRLKGAYSRPIPEPEPVEITMQVGVDKFPASWLGLRVTVRLED